MGCYTQHGLGDDLQSQSQALKRPPLNNAQSAAGITGSKTVGTEGTKGVKQLAADAFVDGKVPTRTRQVKWLPPKGDPDTQNHAKWKRQDAYSCH
jgi:hypothetical protein